jgi:hypothetical protein
MGARSGKAQIEDRRRRLMVRIKAFHRKGEAIWERVDPDETPLAPDAVQFDELDDDGLPFWDDDTTVVDEDTKDTMGEGQEADLGENWNDSDKEDEDESLEAGVAEDIRLMMPSALGAAECRRQGKTLLMSQEIELRLGQANDALENLRVALAHLCLLYRVEIRHAKSQKVMTRAQAQVKQANRTVNKHVGTYRQAYQALLNMEAQIPQFQPITREDLKMSGDIVEENRIGQRNDTMAWFWRIGGNGEKERDSDWMQECEKFSLCY